ncbi:multidrug ABC transporter ATP-binding protein [Sinosporangium siamense]|uniref:Multidrug ABC transporter ATP-binding protein n=1 Tax=Sinosporangium siamense TaxID=1367973 RepID=A0A919V728_9ACTN|nr:multidrug ABC transporter ATP-binding protein [Sinosporangium siamense]
MSFEVGKGEIFGILGPNGAGKTTTVECLEGLRRPDGGELRVLGLDPRTDGAALRERVGVQLQESHLPERMRVGEALELFASFYRSPAPWRRVMDDWGLTGIGDSAFGALSGGQKQRLFIALALVGAPEVAVLDELTTGLDPQSRRTTWELVEQVRDRGVTVVLVTHFMEEAERLCDRLVLIDSGRVVAGGTPAELVARAVPHHVIAFHTAEPLDRALLAGAPGVVRVEADGLRTVVTGTGNLLHTVMSVLIGHGIVAEDVRLERAGLDEAFLALTGAGRGRA